MHQLSPVLDKKDYCSTATGRDCGYLMMYHFCPNLIGIPWLE